jgi:adenine-specific DNA-methyltransferase
MYPRLYIAKQLLKDDGVIFISIDDNEVAQLRLLMDEEIFGEEHFKNLMMFLMLLI